MTRPKRWYLDGAEEENGIILCNSDGPYKKPNAGSPLGVVSMVSVATDENKGRFSKEEAVLFQCRQGRVVLSIKHHEWNKTATSSFFQKVKTSSDFVAVWKDIENLVHMPSAVTEDPPVASGSTSSSSSDSLHQTSLSNDSFLPAKKTKLSSDIDDEIEDHKVGLIQIPVANLQKPPRDSRLLREPDPTFVRNLKESMIKDPAGPGASTIAVLCKDINKPEEFQEKYKIVYKYEVLGGLHTYLAKLQLTQEFPESSFYKYANADVYVGLSDEQALRLAQRHNQNAHLIHKITHRDLVETCRARLYKLANKEISDPTPTPTSLWKESCKTAIIPENISSTQRDAIFHQASLPKPIWELLLQIMDLFEVGKLKDQKLNLSKLQAKPEFKQHYITPIRSLCESDQYALLERVVRKEISLAELKEIAATKKSMLTLKTAFLKLTNSDSWDKAVETFPNYATEEKLSRFLGCDLKKNIPKPFYDYCHKAKTSEAGEPFDDESESIITFDCVDGPPVNAFFFKAKLTDVTGHMIQRIKPSFDGVDLAIVLIDEQNLEEVDNITYTLKEINAIGGKPIYNVVGICSPSLMHIVKKAWEKAFKHSEYLFVADKSCTKRSNNFLTECVAAVIVSNHSIDGTTLEGYNYTEEERRNFTEVESSKCIMAYLVNHFCCHGGTVLEDTKTGGIACLAALESQRSVVSVVHSDKELEEAYSKISTIKH